MVLAFLTTRVKNPDKDYWGKVRRVLQYLNRTEQLMLTLSAENMDFVWWFIDASNAMHEGWKGHTGTMMNMGSRVTISLSRDQWRNNRSSIEGAFIEVYDCLPTILHAKYFLQSLIHTRLIRTSETQTTGVVPCSRRIWPCIKFKADKTHQNVILHHGNDWSGQGDCQILPNIRDVVWHPCQTKARKRILPHAAKADGSPNILVQQKQMQWNS